MHQLSSATTHADLVQFSEFCGCGFSDVCSQESSYKAWFTFACFSTLLSKHILCHTFEAHSNVLVIIYMWSKWMSLDFQIYSAITSHFRHKHGVQIVIHVSLCLFKIMSVLLSLLLVLLICILNQGTIKALWESWGPVFISMSLTDLQLFFHLCEGALHK